MSRRDHSSEENLPPWRGRRREIAGRKLWSRTSIGLAVLLSCLLCLVLVLPRALSTRRRAGSSPATAPLSQTPFQAAFAEAQRWHLAAQTIAKRRLEALEEWDPDNIRGSMPEIYRQSFIAGTQEIGRARAAAREAARQAESDQDRYRVTRLLVSIEHDLGHHRIERELAKRLVDQRPQSREALLLLKRAETQCEQVSPARPPQR